MRITKCPHHTRKHYAKNMCSSCYRKFGRNEFAVNCPHNDRLLYSKGMCQTCYLSDYHQKRTKVKREKKQEEKQRQKMLMKEGSVGTITSKGSKRSQMSRQSQENILQVPSASKLTPLGSIQSRTPEERTDSVGFAADQEQQLPQLQCKSSSNTLPGGTINREDIDNE